MSNVRRHLVRSALLALSVALGAVLIWADPASAHVDFLGSEPADGSVVADPVPDLRFEFSGDIVAAPEQVFVFDSDGASLEIAEVAVVDGNTLVVTPAVPLADGRFGAQWAVRAGDTHPRTGAITFEVTGSAEAVPSSAAAGSGSRSDQVASEESPAATTPSSTVPTDQPTADQPQADELGAALAAAGSGTDGDATGLLGALGRFVAYGGIVLAVGALGFIAWVFEGRRDEVRRLSRLATTGAILAIVGTFVQAAARAASLGDNTLSAAIDPAAWSNLTETEASIGFLMRLAGALIIVATARSLGSRGAGSASGRSRPNDLEAAAGERGAVSTSAAVGTEAAATVDRNAARRFSPGAATWLGALLMLGSGTFIGHTASTSPRALVAASDFAHLASASVWAGGAVALALTIRIRRRSGARGDATLLISRFSVSATWCLVLVALTGLAMTWSILPEPSALWSTTFGWILVLKVALVVAISALGAYNHFVLVPAIRRGDDPEIMRNRMARTLGAEVVLFVAVIAATAALVGSSPT